MADVYVIMLSSAVLIGQLSQCLLSSRCTEINTPCIQIKRDVLTADELNAMTSNNTNNTNNANTPAPPGTSRTV